LTDIQGKKLWIETIGDSDDPAVIFIHGLGSSLNFYQVQVEQLAKRQSSLFIIRFDTEGSGRSPLSSSSLSITSIGTDVIEILDHFKVKKATIVGHSMGGLTANWVASNYRDRIEKVILIAPVHPNAAVGGVMMIRAESVLKQGMLAVSDAIPHAAVGSSCPPVVKAFIRELLMGQQAINVAGYAAACRAIASARAPEYSLITAPVYIIAGEEDKTAPVAGCLEIQRSMTNTNKMDVLPGVGHWICIEASEIVSEKIDSYT